MVFIFIGHYIAEYILQTKEIDRNKNSNYIFLFAHIWIIFGLVAFFGMFVFKDISTAIIFSAWNALAHLTIDFISWRLYTYLTLGKSYGFECLRDPDFNYKEKSDLIHSKLDFLKDSLFVKITGAEKIAHVAVLYELYQSLRDWA